MAVGFGDAKAVSVIGKMRPGNEKTVRVSGEDLQKHIVRRARKGRLLPGKLTPVAMKEQLLCLSPAPRDIGPGFAHVVIALALAAR